MTKIKKICYIPWQGTKKNNEIFNINLGNWEYVLKEELKKEHIEIFTNDLIEIKDADACIIFDNIFYKNLDAIWEMYNNKLLHKSIYIDYEPPSGHCRNHDEEGIKQLSKIFKKVITYNDDLIDNKRIIKGNIGNFYSKEIKGKVKFKDKKFITMITNNTGINNIIDLLNHFNTTDYYNSKNLKNHKNAIYKKREEAANFFLKKCPKEFDLYGILWPEKFNPVLKGYLNKEDKCKILSNYKFIISYDSIINQNGYISEKIFDCFRAGTVPIYWGADNVTDYIPKNCFIDKRNFKTYDDLYDYLRNMTEKEYNQYIKAIEKYLHSEQYKKYFSSEASARIIKDAILKEDTEKNFSYEEAHEALMYFQRKKDEVDKKRKINFYVLSLSDDKKKLELAFNSLNYSLVKNFEYQLYIDDKPIEISEEITRIPNESFEIKFKATIEYKDKPVSIKVFYRTSEINQQLILNDLSGSLANDIGLLFKHDNREIIYYNYLGMSKIRKIIFLIKYNPKKLFIKILNKVKGIIRKN